MLKYQGHIFVGDGASCACCSVQDRKALVDPTGTSALRAKLRATLALNWRKLRVIAKQIIVDHDLLQLNASGLLPVKSPAITQGGSKVHAFQLWFDHALSTIVLGGDGSVMRPMLNQAYMDGVTFGQARVQKIAMLGSFGHTQDTIFRLAVVELQGIMEAVSQQSVRAVAQGLITNKKPMAIVREIFNRIDKIGVVRSNAMVDQLVIAAFNQAALDVYQATGRTHVGLVAEAKPPQRAGDAAISDAKRRRKGAGSRLSRSKSFKGPSLRTIQRIRKQERAVEKLGLVNVRTAEDDDVCPICQDIAEAGPYKIDTARSLIPAHPHCRCAFVPADDARFAQDYNPHHVKKGERGGEFTNANAYSQGSEKEAIKELKAEAPDYFGDNTFTDEEIDAVNEYTRYLDPKFGSKRRAGFEAINSALRKSPAYRTKTISDLDAAISKSYTPRDIVVYRGAGETITKRIEADWKQSKSASWTDHAFVSTSAYKAKATKFSKHVIEIKVKKGTKALPITWNGEAEVLMGRGNRFKVTSVRKTPSGYLRIKAEVM